MLDNSEMDELRRHNARLIYASSPIMVQAQRLLAQTGTVMVLTDPQGIILDIEGDQHLRDAMERVRLTPGACWSETSGGTNAIGTALVLGQPTQIHASEHFCEEVKKWTCSATVIRDPSSGSILGALDISGFSNTYNQHSLPLVAMTAERIENRLAQIEMKRRVELLELSAHQLSTQAEGVILFDCNGHLLRANDKAEAALAAWDATLSANTKIPVPGPIELSSSQTDMLPNWLVANRMDPIFRSGTLLGFVVSVPLPATPPSPPPEIIAAPDSASPPAHPSEKSLPLLSTMLDQSYALVFIKDMAGRYEFVNRRFEEVFKIRSSDAIGKTDAQIFEPALAQTLRRRDMEAISQPTSRESLDELLLADRMILLTAVRFPIRDSSGVVQSVCTQAIQVSKNHESCTDQRPMDLHSAPSCEGVLVTDSEGHIVTVNAAFTQITGYTNADVIGKSPRFLKSGLHSNEFYERLWRSLVDRGRWQGEIQNRRKNGDIYPEWLTIYSIKRLDGRIQSYIAIFGDNSAAKTSQARVEFMRTHDILTNLPNRSLLMDRLKDCVDEAERLKDQITVMLVGLDNVKDLNETLGHDLGDQLLQQITERLRRCICDADTIARVDGDKFAVVLRGETLEKIHYSAANIIDYLSASFCFEDAEFFVTTSIGISCYPADGNTGGILLKNADTALHAAKAGGRNRYQFFAEEMNVQLTHRMSLETAVRAAIEHDHFRVVYQPQVDLVTGKIVGAEALIRWKDPILGEVSPASFIPIAEEADLISSIGEIVLSKVLRHVSLWQRQGLALPRISINIAAQQMQEPHFADHLIEMLEINHVTPDSICIELTEGTLVKNLDETRQTLLSITRQGISISIDDFGTGYSSLSYLSRLPIDELKIDQSFVRNIVDEPSSQSITTAIIEMAHALGASVLAEGIETGAQLQILNDKRCDIGQGYYFHRPLSIEAFEKLLIDGSNPPGNQYSSEVELSPKETLKKTS
jgi:two-component system CheB/CheR fusion protein